MDQRVDQREPVFLAYNPRYILATSMEGQRLRCHGADTVPLCLSVVAYPAGGFEHPARQRRECSSGPQRNPKLMALLDVRSEGSTDALAGDIGEPDCGCGIGGAVSCCCSGARNT